MRSYIVKFYYYADLRFDWCGEAMNELTALMLAMNHHCLSEWVQQKGFRIEIHAKQ